MPIDTAQLQNLINLLGADMLQRVRQSFLEDSEPKIAQLKHAIAERDFAAIEQLSHSLKSASSNLALTELAAELAQLEAQATAHNDADFQRLYDNIESLYVQSVKALSDYF
ncbi:Hpt domain-containing protein [Marinomonas piezotolerans]|nr:Hpt domain-containing protein [Marinomonas piezotolerans]